MRFIVHAVPAAKFSGWLAVTQGEGESLDLSAYTELAKTRSDVSVKTFGNVAPGLFEHIERDSVSAPALYTEH
jgi:hypothetical protein